MNKAQRNLQTLRQHAHGLHQSAPSSLRVYCGFQFPVFMGFPTVWTSGSLTLMPCLGFFSFCWFLLSVRWFCVLLCHFVLFYYHLLEACSFLIRGRKGGSGYKDRWEGTGRSRERKAIIMILLYEGKNLLSIKKNTWFTQSRGQQRNPSSWLLWRGSWGVSLVTADRKKRKNVTSCRSQRAKVLICNLSFYRASRTLECSGECDLITPRR